MTLAKIGSFLGVCCLSLTGGCWGTSPVAHQETAIDFVVRPSTTRTPSGSFEVRGLDNAEHARVGIGSSSPRTLHVRLPAGSYTVAWNPTGSESSAIDEDVHQVWPQIVVVTNDKPATVDVHLVARGTHSEPRLELASAGAQASPSL